MSNLPDPMKRSSEEALRAQIDFVSQNPVIDALLNNVGGQLAVLNEHRQVLIVNETLIQTLGLADANTIHGLRPGEVIGCVHASKDPGGCGTTKFCSTCGAAIAIVTSLGADEPAERNCAAEIKKDGQHQDLFLRVRASPIHFSDKRFLLLFLQDISAEQKRAVLERAFFHDLNNILLGIKIASELLIEESDAESLSFKQQLRELTIRLIKEVEIQAVLVREELPYYKPVLEVLSVSSFFQQLEFLFNNHPAAAGKSLDLPQTPVVQHIRTDSSIISRILTNMLTNAFEATEEGGEVRLWVESTEKEVCFCVWNKTVIEEDVALRIFQRNFSTKQESGRGMGTYAMKMIATESLGGKVDFTTSESEGTCFRLWLPQE